MQHSARIYVAGGTTLLGRALLELLRAQGYDNLVGEPPHEPDLTSMVQVEEFFHDVRPQYVILAAGDSGGIDANVRRPADLMLSNLLTSTHVIHQAHRHNVEKLLYLASSCSYPKHAPQPMTVESLMTGPLEPTNDAYALAKLAGWKLCEAHRRQHGAAFHVAIPANPFGPFDDFSPDNSHVIPALLRRMHHAKVTNQSSVTVWGTGKPRREFLYVRDLADACLFLLNQYEGDAPINVGSGEDHSIAEVAELIAEVVGYRGELIFDTSRPDGMPRKVLDSRPLSELGWKPKTDLRTAVQETYAWYLKHYQEESVPDASASV